MTDGSFGKPLSMYSYGAVLFALVFIACAAAACGEVVGWRTDGTGRYPEAQPVLEWGGDTNVVWKTPMPARGNATPVITGERLFVTAEPTDLICVNLADGAILWRRPNDYDTFAESEEEAARIRETMAEARALRSKLQSAQREQARAQKKLKVNPGDEGLKKESEALAASVSALKEELNSCGIYAVPITQEVNGYSSPTPVTDGSHVYAVFVTGSVICYDMEGNRRWARTLEHPPHTTYGSSSSPLLVGDTLVVAIDHLWGLDPATGQTRWKVKLPWGWGTPVHASIGGTDVVFTSQGNVVRVSDGKVLPPRLSKLEYNGPTLHGDVIYYIQHDPRAYRIPGEFDDNLQLEELWVGKIEKDRYYGCPLIHDGLIYAITQQKHFSVIEQQTGRTVYEKKLSLGSGIVFPSITLGGDHLFISGESGTTIVLEPAREYKEVAKNTLEPFRACPVFLGTRMYIRGMKHLYCIGK